MTMDEARQIAAQAWCDPETSGIEMDVRLAEAFAKRLVASRSSSGSEGREAGFREGVEAAARWLVEEDAVRKPGIPAEAARVMRLLSERCASRMRRALSSAPPSPSDERVRALAQKCVEDVRAIGQRYRDDWSDFDGRTLKEELIEATWGLRRALSPQGDGTPEPKTKE